jgi:hypothetical protein
LIAREPDGDRFLFHAFDVAASTGCAQGRRRQWLTRFPTVLVGWWGACRGVHLRSWAAGRRAVIRSRSRLNGGEPC